MYGQRTMGQDYSYTQPSSSDEFEADLYADEGESSYTIAEADQYSPEPEADEGIPRTCYCGSEPVVATSYTTKDPGRRFSSRTCEPSHGCIWSCEVCCCFPQVTRVTGVH
ncbi:hypothetical protein Bca52824_045735 [Brassica carinata]|uniref:Uncharacterized protein n=1 Tax=Brassica carinata TaxID=52824 RepID=A0A8X7URR5_BRACI|nr:hypothetical protein Bca52824_045735 [Brassica carinata]